MGVNVSEPGFRGSGADFSAGLSEPLDSWDWNSSDLQQEYVTYSWAESGRFQSQESIVSESPAEKPAPLPLKLGSDTFTPMEHTSLLVSVDFGHW